MRTNVIFGGKKFEFEFQQERRSGENKLSNIRNFIIYLDRERALPPSTEISELTFVMKKVQYDASRGVIF